MIILYIGVSMNSILLHQKKTSFFLTEIHIFRWCFVMGSRNPPLASTGSAFIPSISVDQTSPAATGTANPNNFRQYPPLPPSHSAQQVHPPLPLASATPTPAATTTNTPLNDVTRSPGRMQSGASSRAENLQGMYGSTEVCTNCFPFSRCL